MNRSESPGWRQTASPWAVLIVGALALGLVDAKAVLKQQGRSLFPEEAPELASAVLGVDLGLSLLLAGAAQALLLGLWRVAPGLRRGAAATPAPAWCWRLGPAVGLGALVALGLLRHDLALGLELTEENGLLALGGLWLALVLLGCWRRYGVGWILLFGLFSFGYHGSELSTPSSPTRGEGAAPRPPLVLVTLDTFRADHLGAIGGYWREVRTPHLDALAEEGLLFTEGVAPVPLTLPSHAAMLTGAGPLETGLVRNGEPLSPDLALVSERLAGEGWTTGAFVSAAVLDGATGIGRGFAHHDDRFGLGDRLADGVVLGGLEQLGLRSGVVRRSGALTVARALRWLEAQEGEAPVFLWVHLYDPHGPYDPPSPHDTAYAWDHPDAPGNPEEVEAGLRATRRAAPQAGAGLSLVERDLRERIARYAGGITWTDELVGRLLAGLPEGSEVLVAADHGESLAEHGYFTNHGARLYQVSLRVPIILASPSRVAPGRVEEPVPLEGVAPTLAWLAGLAPAGPTLLELAAEPPAELASFTEGQEARSTLTHFRVDRVAVRQGQHKGILSGGELFERYDLVADPSELVDLDADRADLEARARELREALREARADRGGGGLDPQQERALRALGYVD